MKALRTRRGPGGSAGHWTTGQLARLLGVHDSSVRRWCARGLVPAEQTDGKHWRIANAVAQSLLRSGRAADGWAPARLAKAIGMNESSVRRWCKAGRIPATVSPAGHWHIPLSSVVELIGPQALQAA